MQKSSSFFYGVFRKIQQPSVSPVASHLKQALLESAEKNLIIICYLNNTYIIDLYNN